MIKKGKPRTKGGMAPSLPPDWSKFKSPFFYRNGAEGFISWVEDNCYFPLYPTGSDIAVWVPAHSLPEEYKVIWEGQKTVVREVLKMKDGKFVYRLIVLCWMRGEGKSFLACLIQLWKFFNWTRQNIVLGANSKEQTKFVHYDIMRDIILNSPNLLVIVGRKNVQEKEIKIKNEKGEVESTIKAISSFSGIVSNITGYTFSEIFDMKNPKFFVQLDGSTRNIPNALGVIDSTVSAKTHVLYKLYTAFISGKDKLLFFSYRSSPTADSADFWNPHMTHEQLRSYEERFPFGEFDRYFKNVWSAGVKRVFTDDIVDATHYVGCDGVVGNHEQVIALLRKKHHMLDQIADFNKKSQIHLENTGSELQFYNNTAALDEIESRLIPIDATFRFEKDFNGEFRASLSDLEQLSELYDTNWAIGVGLDRSDPMAKYPLARTIFTVTAKGLPGSKSNPRQYYETGKVPKYIYINLQLSVVIENNLEEIKRLVEAVIDEYDGVDALCFEKWGAFDLAPWCEERGIQSEFISPSYVKQKEAFSELYLIWRDGRYKSPVIPIRGSKESDILREEARLFDHDSEHKEFGSPEKGEKGGVQDDCMYSLGWCIYGTRNLGINDFRERKSDKAFGTFIPNKELSGAW